MSTQAIQAAAEMINPHVHGDRDFEDLTSAEQETARSIAKDAIDAARPFIEAETRAKIAAEITAEADRLESTMHLHDQDQDSAQNVVIGVLHAANIAEGEQ